MNFFDMNSEVCNLRAEEERILASFTRSLIEIAAAAEARGSVSSPTAALNAMRLPAIALDQHGVVAEVNAAAEAVFDNDVKITDRRLFLRDPTARALLKEVIDQLRTSPPLNPLATDPIIVQRRDKMPVIVRIWPFDGATHLPAQEVRALLTLNALGPKPGPPAAILAKTGNGLTVTEDLARRFISCELDARCEDPELRPFPVGFLDQIEQRRAELLTAALTIWRWGRQNATGLTRGKAAREF